MCDSWPSWRRPKSTTPTGPAEDEPAAPAEAKLAVPAEEEEDVNSKNGKLVGATVKKAVCEICNFFHSFVDTLLKPER